MPTKIIINRKGEFATRGRAYKVIIDGKECEPIANGNSGEYIVEPGVHTVQCKMRLFISPELTVTLNEGEAKFLKARSAMKLFGILYVTLLVAVIAPILPQLKHNDTVLVSRTIVIAVILLYFVYYITFARKRSLILETDKDNIFS